MDADLLLSGLGQRVRELRTEHGLTLKDLAGRAGLSLRFVGQVESGVGNISVRNLAALAHALRTTPAALLSGPGGEADLPVISLLGLRGAGKTTVGKRLARRLHIPFVELDRRIEEAADLSLAEVFALHGEDYYRRLEREALDHALATDKPQVLATGGGIVTSPQTFALLRHRTLTVWLKADPEQHWNRVVQQGDRRPMADHPQAMAELRRLLAARTPLYAEAALTVDTRALDVDGVVHQIEAGMTAGGVAPSTAGVGSNPYAKGSRTSRNGNFRKSASRV